MLRLIAITVVATVALGAEPALALRANQQQVANIPPVAPAIAKVYDRDPAGVEFYNVRALALEPAGGALWVESGEPADPPLRIDRRTGAVKAIGRAGSGPDEYRSVISFAAGIDGDMGAWDSVLRKWFWIDSAGRQRRTWSLPTNTYDPFHAFTDAKGNVYVGQPAARTIAALNTSVPVRLDSVAGLRDTMMLPFVDARVWSVTAVRATASSRSTSSSSVMFAPRVIWGIDRRGRLFSAWSDSNFVLIRDGKSDRRLQLPVFREPLTAEDRATASKWLDEFETNAKSQGMQIQGPRPPIPDVHPTIDDVIIEMNGGLAIQRTRPCGTIPEWRAPGTRAPAKDPKDRCTLVERFDGEGRRLRPFTLAQGDRLWVIRADTAWVTHNNADGIVRILELTIPKG